MAWIEIEGVKLNRTQKDNNAWECYNFFTNKTWVVEAIAAICGNMDLESTINPQLTNTSSGAYGLTQWITNKQNMKNWCTANGYAWNSGVGQVNYIEYERTHQAAADQWYGRGDYVGMSFTDFAHNTRNYSVSTLTHCFWRCYERSKAYQTDREEYAAHYYEMFTGSPPPGRLPLWLLLKRKKWWYKGGSRYV